jgi:hypothetical protein
MRIVFRTAILVITSDKPPFLESFAVSATPLGWSVSVMEILRQQPPIIALGRQWLLLFGDRDVHINLLPRFKTEGSVERSLRSRLPGHSCYQQG